MAGPFILSASPAVTLLAAACVIAGGPWFAQGLRAWRARRSLRALGGRATDTLRDGPLVAEGRVVLDTPLFAPLSGRACAGFELEVRDDRGTIVGRVREERDFLLELDTDMAEVTPGADWLFASDTERGYGSPAELSDDLRTLLSRTAELRWLAARGGPLSIRERALLAGARVHVLGCGVRCEPAVAEPIVLQRTGTDDVALDAWGPEPGSAWRIEPGEALERCVVSARAPDPNRVMPPAWRASGLVLGPALTLAGLLVLAQAAGRLAVGGR